MRAAASFLVGCIVAARLLAQAPAPVLLEVFPPAGQPGATVQVTLSGKRLAEVAALWFDHPGLRAVLRTPSGESAGGEAKETKKEGGKEKTARQPSTLSWDLTVDPSVPPGLYDMRVVNGLGASAPRAIHVSPVPLLAGKDPADGKPVDLELESRVAGQVDPGVVERFRLKTPRAARVVVECFAERIDSRLDATLEVKDVSGRRVSFSADRLGLDPALAFDAREGGEYTIELWDFTYGGKYPYLLSVSTRPRALFAFPPAVMSPLFSPRGDVPARGEGPAPDGERSAGTELVIHGWNLPGSEAVPELCPWRPEGGPEPLEALRVSVPAAAAAPAPAPPCREGAYLRTSCLLSSAVALRPPGLATEPLVLPVAAGPQSLEREPNDAPAAAQPLSVPCEVSGRFGAGDRDWFSFQGRKGQAIEVEVQSARLGAPCDPVLLIGRREEIEKGKEGAGAEKASRVRDLLYLDERKSGMPKESFEKKFVAPERDPSTVFTPPDDGEYLVLVRSRGGRCGPEAIYRLCLRPPAPDFALVVTHTENQSGEALTLPRGGSATYDVLLERRGGFQGGVEVMTEGLPEGVTAPAVHFGPGESYVPLALTASPEAKSWTGPIRVAGRAAMPGGAEVRRQAWSSVMVYGGAECRHPLEYVHSRFSDSLVLAVRESTAPFRVRLEPAELALAPGEKGSLKVRVERGPGFAEAVQLSFQGLGERGLPEENGNRPAKATVAKEKAEAEVPLSPKSDSPLGEHTFVVFASAPVEYAERSSDGQGSEGKAKKEKRRTTLVSNPVRVTLVSPVSLTGPRELEPGPRGGSLRVPFEVRRRPGADEVEVSLDLPEGVKGFSADKVKLRRDDSRGELAIQVGPQAPERLEGARLRATVQFAGRRFEEKLPLPALEAAPAFQVGLEEARAGVLRLEVRPRGEPPREDLPLRVQVFLPSGKEASGEAVLAKGRASAAAAVEIGTAERGAGPLRVLLQAALPGGALKEEHLVAGPLPALQAARRERSY